jgi:FlaA1/EpsC-like NDP-sugar epimerase
VGSLTVLVTGASGSLGREVVFALADRDVVATDVETMDVTRPERVWQVIGDVRPSHVLHLAGQKHAPEGETDPEATARVNVAGTANVLRAATAVGAFVVTASTCKACDPETTYGASKLIAERLTLNAGGSVARFFNVREAGGNVFRLWESLPQESPLPVADAFRYFISIGEAVDLLVSTLDLAPGRYAVDPGDPVHMDDVAAATHPGRPTVRVPLRRGDRRREPLHAACETVDYVSGGLMSVVGAHDYVAGELVAA